MFKKLILVGAIALLGVVAGLPHPQSSAQGTYDILLSLSPDRSSPAPLDGETVSGDIYVFTSPDDGVFKVRFFIDGGFVKEEKRAPYDLAGTKKDGTALPFDTTTIAEGAHALEAKVYLSDGTVEIVTVGFTVANSGPSLQFSSDKVSFAAQAGLDPSDKTVDIAASDGAGVGYSVSDDASWLSVSPSTGTTPDTLTLSVDVTGLAQDVYVATVTATDTGYSPASLTVELTVTDSLEPDQVHLAWVDDPATTINVVWRTFDSDTESTVEYRPQGDATWQSVTGAPRPSGATGTLHEAQITGLAPASTYEYRVRGDDSTWSQVYTTRTAPPAGPADFDAVYLPDTGLIGREDGLATGTQQVIDEIAALDPNLVLLGGDYAYFNTDKRFGTLDNTIDAWFDQMAPLADSSPMMPTYGNHEVLLGEDFGAWAARFPTPEGFDGRRNYSFDVGDVHFVSILAVSDSDGLSSSTLDWIQQDILAAQAAGQRWIVPFMHVSPYGDGQNHPSNPALRAQLGPLFESLGVQIVFTSHDQAFERSYPLSGMPDLNTPTSTSEVCYTQSDGVVWVKVSPGGKLSNISGGFSNFATDPPPDWTAVRDNTMHHFSRLISSSAGSLTVETYGVVGDGTPPTLLDSFQYTTGACPPELGFDPPDVSLSAEEGETVSAGVTLSASDGSAAAFSLTDDAPWLTVSPTGGTTPATLTLDADSTGLPAGTHHASVTATAGGYTSDTLDVTLEVGLSGYTLMLSGSPDRAGAVALQDQTVAGDIYVFTSPDVDVKQAIFFVDGSKVQTERNAPFDLAGTNRNGSARPYDTTSLTDGAHLVSASLTLSDNSTLSIEAGFFVSNSAPSLAFDPNPLTLSADEGASVSSTVQLNTTDGGAAAFAVTDDAGWLTVTPDSGSTPQPLTMTADASALPAGIYAATVTAAAPGYLDGSLNVTFIVGGSYDILVSASPDRSIPLPLDGETVAGDIYAFTSPDFDVKQVIFFVDGSKVKTENNAPFDLAGTNNNGLARPYDTTNLTDGAHIVAASLNLSSGATVNIAATMSVVNNAPSLQFSPGSLNLAVEGGGSTSTSVTLDTTDALAADYSISDDADWLTVSPASGNTPDSLTVSIDASSLADGFYNASVTATSSTHGPAVLAVTLSVGAGYDIWVSEFADRSDPVPLDGATVSGDIHAFTSPDTNVVKVEFWVDDPSMSGTPTKVESNAPFDLAGTNPDDTAKPYATAQLADGGHTVTAKLYLSSGQTVVVTVNFVADNGCFPLPCSEVLVDLPYELDYDHLHDHGGVRDGNGVGTGFTYIDQPTNGTTSNGYLPDNLLVDLVNGVFQVTSTAGLADGAANGQDNRLGVGVDAPSQITIVNATLLDPPAGGGSDEQAGLWWATDEDNFVRLGVVSTPSGTVIDYMMEVNGLETDRATSPVLDLAGAVVQFSLRADPADRSMVASYSVNGGAFQALGTFTAPGEFFSFDAAGIDPLLGTRSFTGIYASHGGGPGPLTYTFQQFSIDEQALPVVSSGDFTFDKSSFPVFRPTSLAWGPDGRLYVTELFGTIHALTLDADKQLVDDQVIATLTNDLGSRLTLGLTVDPLSTPGNVILWVSHSSPSLNNGVPNSGMISRISGASLDAIEHVITGLPRAKANHATNSIHFGPDGKLYIAQGGNTGAGAPGGATGEFGDREEQPLSAAILVADVRDPAFDGSCNNPDDIYGPPPCDVTTFVTGLRNSYDFVFHSSGQAYAPDNGLGVAGTYPPSPTPPCLGFADPALHSPGEQPDILVRLQESKFYGHPDPHRDECVFKDGSFQGVPPLPNYEPPALVLGNSKSADGTIEYTSDAFCGALQSDLLIANFSVGDDITRVQLSDDGLFALDSETLIGGFSDPLPLLQGPDGTIYVGEFGASLITALTPVDRGCWEVKQPLPQAILDAGSAALGGELYSVAGKTSAAHISTMYIYDPATNTWATGPDLPGPAVENPAVVALGGKLYAFGGSTDPFSGAVGNAAVYDPATNTWTPLTPMPTARGGAAAQAINGKIYVVGGLDAAGSSLATVEVYDPATDSWSAATPMATPRDNPGSAVLDGQLYVFGGRHRGVDDTLSSVEAYDPASDTWSAKAPMPTGRRTMVVGTLNGRAQVMGGERTSGGGSFAANEEYDPLTNSWRALTDMQTPRHGAAAGTIDGVVYVAGGGPTGGSAFSDVLEAFAFQNAP